MEPNPALLDVALEAESVWVSTSTSRESESVPVGYLAAVCDGDCHVTELAVAPEARREGRASALLEAVRGAADGRLTLQVAADNYPALALYREHGFEVVEERPDGYASGAALLLASPPESAASGPP